MFKIMTDFSHSLSLQATPTVHLDLQMNSIFDSLSGLPEHFPLSGCLSFCR